MDNIHTFNELQEISGYKMPGKVRAWLKVNHIPFIVARNNHPLVNKSALAYKMGAPLEKQEKQSIEPNFGAI